VLRWGYRQRGLHTDCCGGGAGEGARLLIAAVAVQAKETACGLLRWGCMRRRPPAACCGGGAGEGDRLLAAPASTVALVSSCITHAAGWARRTPCRGSRRPSSVFQ
jgi:hypothetical protein